MENDALRIFFLRLSRPSRIELKLSEGLYWARKAVGIRLGWSTVRTLAAAGDEAASIRAASLFSELGQEVPFQPVDFVAVQGARLMADQGDVEEAVGVLMAVTERSPGYEPARQLLAKIGSRRLD